MELRTNVDVMMKEFGDLRQFLTELLPEVSEAAAVNQLQHVIGELDQAFTALRADLPPAIDGLEGLLAETQAKIAAAQTGVQEGRQAVADAEARIAAGFPMPEAPPAPEESIEQLGMNLREELLGRFSAKADSRVSDEPADREIWQDWSQFGSR